MILYLGSKEETEAWCLNPLSYATDSFSILTVFKYCIVYTMHSGYLLGWVNFNQPIFWRLTHVQKCI